EQVMTRDAKAEQEVLNEMHRMHEAFDRGDVDAISRCISDDDFLFVYELDPEGKPVKLNSKQELVVFLQKTFKTFEAGNAVTEAKNPVMTARATSAYAVVTEECSLKVRIAGGKTQVQSLRATAVARKGDDGWKWTHWHMSPSAPRVMIEAE